MAQPQPDLLSDALAALQLRTSAIAAFELSAPWGMDVPFFGPAFLYAVIEGSLHLHVEGQPNIHAVAGDVFVTPRGDDTALRSSPGEPLVYVGEMFAPGTEQWTPGARLQAPLIIRWGGGGEVTRLLAVLLDFADAAPGPLGLNLPKLIYLKREENHISPWLGPAAQAMVEEARAGRLGFFAMATRLAELLFINAIRTHLILRPQDATGWLLGLSDPRIARALAAVHRDPARPWSVEALAAEAGMSRSAFAERFVRLVGQTPFDYVTQWRMRLAKGWIEQGRCSIKAAAHDLGYSSEKAFSQAFKRVFKASPSQFRPGRPPPTVRPPDASPQSDSGRGTTP